MNEARKLVSWIRPARSLIVLAAMTWLTGSAWAQMAAPSVQLATTPQVPPVDAAEQALSADLRVLVRPGGVPMPPSNGGTPDQSYLKDVAGTKYVKAIVWLRAPGDFQSVRDWIVDSKLGAPQRGSVHYRYQSFPAMSVMLPLSRMKELTTGRA